MENRKILPRFQRSSPKFLLAAFLFAVPVVLSVRAASGPDRDASTIVESFVQNFLGIDPVGATAQGYHQQAGIVLDELLDDYSPQGITNSRKLAQRYLDETSRLKAKTTSSEDRADLDVIRLQCQTLLLDLDNLQSFRHNPTVYVELLGNAIYTPFVLNYAPETTRMRQITARLEKIPAFLTTAKSNLIDAPPIWSQVAQQENEGNIALIDKTVRAKVPADLLSHYNGAASAAIASLQDFNSFLANDLSKRPSEWRLGKERYAEKFKLALATDDTPQSALTAAEAELRRIREDMRKQALAVYPEFFPGQTPPADLNSLVSQVLDKVAQQHTTPEHYFDSAKRDLADTTAFVKTKGLLALPENGNLQVIPTPEFMRGIYGVGGFSPAPVLEPNLGAFYWITPFTPDMSPARVESKLREYNTWGLKILTIHEAMPGHYVQAEYASRIQPKWRGALRAIFSNNPYVEGWAVYATELMIDSGYENNPQMRLTFGKQMLRVLANTILDVRLHTMGMTDQEALDLMIRDTFQEREEAEKKLQRAKLSSCQLPTYFVGWRAWDQLRAAYRQEQGSAFSLPEFHQRALNEGAVPMPVLRGLLVSHN
jgi:uncharacterized protein (DUF885 family)